MTCSDTEFQYPVMSLFITQPASHNTFAGIVTDAKAS